MDALVAGHNVGFPACEVCLVSTVLLGHAGVSFRLFFGLWCGGRHYRVGNLLDRRSRFLDKLYGLLVRGCLWSLQDWLTAAVIFIARRQ